MVYLIHRLSISILRAELGGFQTLQERLFWGNLIFPHPKSSPHTLMTIINDKWCAEDDEALYTTPLKFRFECYLMRVWLKGFNFYFQASPLAAFYPPKMRFPPRGLRLTSSCFSYTCELELTCNFEAAHHFLKYMSLFLPSMQASFFYICKKRERILALWGGLILDGVLNRPCAAQFHLWVERAPCWTCDFFFPPPFMGVEVIFCGVLGSVKSPPSIRRLCFNQTHFHVWLLGFSLEILSATLTKFRLILSKVVFIEGWADESNLVLMFN